MCTYIKYSFTNTYLDSIYVVYTVVYMYTVQCTVYIVQHALR